MTIPQSKNGSSSNCTSYKLKLLGVLLTVGYLLFLISGQETSMFLNLISSCDTTSSNLKEASSFVTYSSTSSEVHAVDATVKEGTEPITKIILLGERHSGTNWITDHLEECFGKDIAVSFQFFKPKKKQFAMLSILYSIS